jgi:hypothetical protein
MKKLLIPLLAVCLFPVNTFAYGPRGHQLVGSIADKRLARNRAVARKVRQLLDGLTLAEVATLPDQIKSWEVGTTAAVDRRVLTALLIEYESTTNCARLLQRINAACGLRMESFILLTCRSRAVRNTTTALLAEATLTSSK